VIPCEELTRNAYDDLRFQHVLIEEMGELLPALLLEECDLSRARSILEIGCGAGEWLRAVARRYPDLQCIGIDQDEHPVKSDQCPGLSRWALTGRLSRGGHERYFPLALSRGELRFRPSQLPRSLHPDSGLPEARAGVHCPVPPRRDGVLDGGRAAAHY